MARRSTTKKEHYVDNKEFLAAMIEYKEKCEKAKKRKILKWGASQGINFIKIILFHGEFISRNFTYHQTYFQTNLITQSHTSM